MDERVADLNEEPLKVPLAIDGYQNHPLLPLERAVEPLVSFFDGDSLLRNVWIAKERCAHPSDNLTTDESAAIMLYTLNWETKRKSFYCLLNAALRKEKREELVPWFSYLKLFLTALNRLPPVKDNVFRGVRSDLSSKYLVHQNQFWWSFSSCTAAVDVLETEQFCGKQGSRTVFSIRCFSGRSIRNHSAYEYEYEILLIPGFYFNICRHCDMGNGLRIIPLEEKKPQYPILSVPEKPGIYIEGICFNRKCSMKDERIRVVFGCCRLDALIEIDVKNSKCPHCSNYIEPQKYGFLNCMWRYEGIIQERPGNEPKKVSRDWQRVDGVALFSENENNNTAVRWRQLILEAKELPEIN